jgi:predicted amidophosphoribosyltransferase
MNAQLGILDRKILDVKRIYGDDQSPVAENLSDICPKCSTIIPRMFSFCSRCGAFHDEHNYVDLVKAQQKKSKKQNKKF